MTQKSMTEHVTGQVGQNQHSEGQKHKHSKNMGVRATQRVTVSTPLLCTYTEGVYRGINQADSSLPHHRDPKGQLNLLSSSTVDKRAPWMHRLLLPTHQAAAGPEQRLQTTPLLCEFSP